MIGILSLLTGKAFLEVQSVQHQVVEKHDMLSTGFPRPHLTYALATAGSSGEALEDLIEGLDALAAATDPFTIHTMGLGLFSKPALVLYLPVPRSPALASVQQAICGAIKEGGAVQAHYRPPRWLAHISLVSAGLTKELLPAVIQELVPLRLDVSSRLTGFSLAEEIEKDHWEITREFPFRGQNEIGQNPFGLTSRPCQPSDQDFVHGLVVETLKPVISAIVPWEEKRFEQGFADSWPQKVIILAEGRPVACIQYDASPVDHLYIGSLLLAPSVQGRGWGRWLLDHMEGLAGGRPVRLHVWENNPAVSFYQCAGYRIVNTEGHKRLMEK